MNQQATMRNVTLMDLWDIFVHRLWLLILVAIAAVGGMFLIIHLTYVPEYESTATLYILRQDGEQTASSTSADFSLALNVVEDCTYLLKSHSVLDEVIDELQLEIPYEDLSKSVSTSNPESTRILEVKVKSDSPQRAKEIVDSVCRIGTDKIEEAMGFSQVNLYEYGILDTKPCNQTGLMTYALVSVVAAILTYSIFLIAFLLDDRIRTEEDIERYLGLSILGDIPSINDTKKHHYGYYAAYGPDRTKKSEKGGET